MDTWMQRRISTSIALIIASTAILELYFLPTGFFEGKSSIRGLMQFLIPLVFLPTIRIRKRTPGIVILGLWSLLFSFSLSSAFWSDYPGLTIQRTILVFLPPMVLMALVNSDKCPTATFRMVARVLVGIGMLLSVVGLLLFLVGRLESSAQGVIQVLDLGPFRIAQRIMGIPPFIRISSLTGNPNKLASILMITIPLTIFLHDLHEFSRIRTVALLIPQVVSMVLTFSRAGLITVWLVLAVMYFLGYRKKGSRFAGLVLLATAGIAFLLFQWVLIDNSRFTTSLTGREQAWGVVWENFSLRPMVGLGFGVIFEALLAPLGLDITAHSIHLTLLGELGIIGYLMYLIISFCGMGFAIVSFLRGKSETQKRTGLALFALVFGYTVHQVVEASIIRAGFHNILWTYFLATASVLSPREVKPCVMTANGHGIQTSATY